MEEEVGFEKHICQFCGKEFSEANRFDWDRGNLEVCFLCYEEYLGELH